MLFALATVVVCANQVLCGLALTLIGTGLAATVGKASAGTPSPAVCQPPLIPGLSDLPFFGRAVFRHNFLIYVIFIALPLALHPLMFRTRHGLDMRAVGKYPAAADAAGIPVMRLRFLDVMAGASLAAGAGACLTQAFVPSLSEGVVAGRGRIAVGR